jgi:phosphoribosylanthranilate isomerase
MDITIPSSFIPGETSYVNKSGRLPYIGVTGFTKPADIATAINTYAVELERHGSIKNVIHCFMAGILLSHDILHGTGMPRAPARYPPMKNIPALLDAIKINGKYGSFSAIHYNTKNQYLSDEVDAIIEIIGKRNEGNFGAIQFNVGFIPDAREIKKIRENYRNNPFGIITQINGSVMREHDFSEITSRVAKMPVDHVLIDPSGGRGKEIDVDASSAIYKILRNSTSAGIGFAGGFGPGNVEEKTRRYVQKLGTTRFSIDAESGVRDPANDAMDVGRVNAYIHGFFAGIDRPVER